MLSFRKKILISDLILFFVFLALLFPFVERTVGNIMRNSLENRATQLIAKLETAHDVEGMADIIQNEDIFLFQWLTLLDSSGKVLYDTQMSRLREKGFFSTSLEENPEIQEAIHYGRGYNESYSDFFKESFAFVAMSFEANGQKYILRTGFPFHEIRELTVDFEVGFLMLGTFILLLYSVMTWAIIHRFTQPIQQIIEAIMPYQEGREEFLPKIKLRQAVQGDDFSKLAFTLNSLSERIQKQIENLIRQKKETEEILDSLGEGVVGLDTSAKVTYANQTACRMLGVAQDAMMNESLDQIKTRHPDLSKKSHETVLQALQTSEPIVQTWTRGEGGRLYLDLISAPLAHQNGAILVIQDKTSDYKVLEMGKDFIANASHELRTPITIIRGFAETLQDLPDLKQDMLQEITEKIVKTCGRLDKLVKSLLTLSDIENLSQDKLRPVDLALLVENSMSLIRTAHPGVDLVFQSEMARAIIVADSDLIDLAVINLLENAVKYSPPPAHIEMTLKRAGNEVQLIISDSGIGIPEADLPHIFDRFYTVDKARSRKSGGAGLGLSIVKTVMQKHRGHIAVSSQLGKGTVFTLSFPLKST